MKLPDTIALMALDLDGTLLRPDSTMSKETAHALHDLYLDGTKIMLCSGRIPTMVEAFQKYAQIEGPIASCNGAMLYETAGEMIYSMPIDHKAIYQLVSLLDSTNSCYSLLSEKDIYYNKSFNHFSNTRLEKYACMARRYGMYIPKCLKIGQSILQDTPIYKVIVEKTGKQEIDQDLDNRLKRMKKITVTSSDSKIFDIGPEKITKGVATSTYAKLHNISKMQICVAGNYYNDLYMFEQAGYSIAPNNAPISIQKQATYVASSNAEDGIARLIEKYLKERQ